ncbi:hypothetical protein PILCRDRAFT_815936 [Piloderma croceum F 1598]|uniref:Ubiquitin-like domain-containing protein n=1 Tax=Piloderma croceum (strain F 1598) TaxID=765440 RepID=A0A0C3G7Q9_PILCF|nr:hypothetical protein PILCRDRAFT_815936 [Piloderma croceum F 1598]
MAEQAETAFVKTFLNNISNQPVTYSDDYQQPLEKSLKRVPVLPIGLPAPPARKQRLSESSTASLTLTFKSLKPPQSFTLPVQSTDTIQSIKSLLASQPRAPPADAQRLLLKGKALADAKLLKEYNIKDGDTINLMIKPGNTWNPNAMTAPDSISAPLIPSVVLSPSPSSVTPSSENSKPLDINLTLDTSSIPTASSKATDTAYHATISDPAFWQELLKLLQTHFKSTDDVHTAFEDFFCASKGKLTATEIAKIRNVVEVFGMAGT